ncbi:MAG: hypothetical protein R3Y62_01490 [Eubacteriales bacterium]
MAKSLSQCRTELRSILTEMESIESGIRSDFTGIGQDLCGNCLEKVITRYEYALTKLNNVNENRLASWLNSGD